MSTKQHENGRLKYLQCLQLCTCCVSVATILSVTNYTGDNGLMPPDVSGQPVPICHQVYGYQRSHATWRVCSIFRHSTALTAASSKLSAVMMASPLSVSNCLALSTLDPVIIESANILTTIQRHFCCANILGKPQLSSAPKLKGQTVSVSNSICKQRSYGR